LCNFAPGECLAIAEDVGIEGRLQQWHFPGQWEIIPLVPEDSDVKPCHPMRKFVLIHMTGIPDGLEVLAVSKLSAALNDLIGDHAAVVELNLYLPFGAQPAAKRHDEFSPPAVEIVGKMRRYLAGVAPVNRAVGLLDSGISVSRLSQPNRIRARDYSGSRGSDFGRIIGGDHDLLGHGTDVCAILDSVLPSGATIVSGKLVGGSQSGITVLRVAIAFAHLICLDDPAVVNLSLAPRDDEVICPYCKKAIAVEAFHSLILPFLFRIVGDRTLTVMAAGNRHQFSNARHALAETSSLVLVEASDSHGQLANYSNKVDSAYAAVARAFGGDDPKLLGGTTVFANSPTSFGTSFAAPFVTAAAYAYASSQPGPVSFDLLPGVEDFGSFCRRELDIAIQFLPSALSAAQKVQVPVPA